MKTNLVLLLVSLPLLLIVWALFSHKKAEPSQPLGGIGQATYFAHVDKNGVVDNVIVASQAFIDSGAEGNSTEWIQTDPNESIRKNYAGQGYTYDKTMDAFIGPKPALDATLNTNTGKWEVPDKGIPPIQVASTTP